MMNLRMPKGWTLVGTNAFEFSNMETKQETAKRFHKFDNLIRKFDNNSKRKTPKIEDKKNEKK